MTVKQPAFGSKPSPVTPEESRKIATEKAHTTEMSLERYLVLCRHVGAFNVRFEHSDDGSCQITLKGFHKSKHVAVDVLSPAGQPLPLYAMQALEEFKLGRGEPIEPEDPAEDFDLPELPKWEDPEIRKNFEAAAEYLVGAKAFEAWLKSSDHPAAKAAREAWEVEPPPHRPEEPLKATPGFPHGLNSVAHEAVGRIAAAETAAKLAKEAASVHDPFKPPEAGQGKRRALNLPLCEGCKAQPVYKPGAQFCGGECARQWHMQAAQQRNVKL